MQVNITVPDHGLLVEALLEGLVQAAVIEIQHGVVPPFPTPDIRFIPEEGTENWLLPHQVAKAGGGDCEDLAAWVAAGYRATGEDPGAHLRLMQVGQTTLHCIVQRGDGSFEDPAGELQRARVSGYEIGAASVVVRNHKGSGPTAAWASAPPAAPNASPTQRSNIDVALANKQGTLPTTTQWYQSHGGSSTPAWNDAQTRMIQALQQYGSTDTFGQATRRTTTGVDDPRYQVDVGPDGNFFFSRARSGQGQGGQYYNPYDPYGGYGGYGDPYGGYGGYGGYGYDPSVYGYTSPNDMSLFNPWAITMANSYGAGEGYAGWYSSASSPMLTYGDLYGGFGAGPPNWGYGGGYEETLDDLGIDGENVIDAQSSEASDEAA